MDYSKFLTTGSDLVKYYQQHNRGNLFKFNIKDNVGFVVDVYDGDTITILCYEKNNDAIPVEVKVRLYGIDAPEKKSRDKDEKEHAKLARNRLCELILHKLIILDVKPDKDQYGRLICELFKRDKETGNAINVNKLLIEEGHARPYDGGHKEEWNFKK